MQKTRFWYALYRECARTAFAPPRGDIKHFPDCGTKDKRTAYLSGPFGTCIPRALGPRPLACPVLANRIEREPYAMS
eukprot:906505-Rhodomonas_salina.1